MYAIFFAFCTMLGMFFIFSLLVEMFVSNFLTTAAGSISSDRRSELTGPLPFPVQPLFPVR